MNREDPALRKNQAQRKTEENEDELGVYKEPTAPEQTPLPRERNEEQALLPRERYEEEAPPPRERNEEQTTMPRERNEEQTPTA